MTTAGFHSFFYSHYSNNVIIKFCKYGTIKTQKNYWVIVKQLRFTTYSTTFFRGGGEWVSAWVSEWCRLFLNLVTNRKKRSFVRLCESISSYRFPLIGNWEWAKISNIERPEIGLKVLSQNVVDNFHFFFQREFPVFLVKSQAALSWTIFTLPAV